MVAVHLDAGAVDTKRLRPGAPGAGTFVKLLTIHWYTSLSKRSGTQAMVSTGQLFFFWSVAFQNLTQSTLIVYETLLKGPEVLLHVVTDS